MTLAPAPGRHSAAEVFRVALELGLTSFGGPIAYLGYFERSYVCEPDWLSAGKYAGLVALCQMLPGCRGRPAARSASWWACGARVGPGRRRLGLALPFLRCAVVRLCTGSAANAGSDFQRRAARPLTRRSRNRGAAGLEHGAEAVPGRAAPRVAFTAAVY